VQIEQHVAVGGKSIGEEHPTRAELVLGVMRPQSLFTNGLGGDDRSVAVALGRKIDDREEVAVLATLVANPRKEITRRALRLTGGGKRKARDGKCGDEDKGTGSAAALQIGDALERMRLSPMIARS
jgi:hypothetical protein